VYR
jgi:putative ABC transport system permease protein